MEKHQHIAQSDLNLSESAKLDVRKLPNKVIQEIREVMKNQFLSPSAKEDRILKILIATEEIGRNSDNKKQVRIETLIRRLLNVVIRNLYKEAISTSTLSVPFVPTDDDGPAILPGSGKGLREIITKPLKETLLRKFQEEEVEPRAVRMVEDQPEKKQMRKHPYYLISIEGLNWKVLVCDQVGEATFLIPTAVEEDDLKNVNKKALQAKYPSILQIKYQAHWTPEIWADIIWTCLQSPVLPSISAGEQAKMDKEYFERTFCVLHDLQAYADAVSEGNIGELTANKILKVRILCANGEQVLGPTYLNRAGVAMDMAINAVEANKCKWKFLNALKKKIGIEVPEVEMDASYFENVENVRKDLQAYADAVAEGDIGKLTTYKMSVERILCANGEQVMGSTYLNRAGVAMGLAINTFEANKYKLKILNLLKKKIGIEVLEVEMDASYFENGEKVRRDLQAYADAVAEGDIGKLTTYKMSKVRVLCTNGEHVLGSTYIKRAGIGVGLAKSTSEANKNWSRIYKALKNVAANFTHKQKSP